MPEWLLKNDEYTAPNTKDTFIEKSILSFFKLLSTIQLNSKDHKKVSIINPSLKLITSLLTIIIVSLCSKIAFIIIIDVFLLLTLSLLDLKTIKHILKKSTLITFITFIFFLPALFIGYKNNSYQIILKVMTTVTVLGITSSTTKYSDLIYGLKSLHVPDIFIFIFDITIKYIVILGDFSLNMLHSLKLRSIGKSKNKNKALYGIIGTMFLKSIEHANEMHDAMECRGFTGEYKIHRKFSINKIDILFILINIMMVLTYFYFDRL